MSRTVCLSCTFPPCSKRAAAQARRPSEPKRFTATEGKNVAHRFLTAGEGEQNRLAVLNDCIYGSSFSDGELRLSLLRGARYSGHPIPETIAEHRIVPTAMSPLSTRASMKYNFRPDRGERG